MLRSKAAAALKRLKEMDRKYNIKRNEVRQSQSNVSTESSPEDTPRNLRDCSKISDNSKSEVDQILKVARLETEVVSKAKDDSIPSSNSESKLKSSEDLSKYQPKTFIADDDTDVMKEEGSLSMSKESTRSPSNAGFTIKATVELKRLASDDPLRTSDESSVATILSKPSDDSEIVSELIKSAEEPSSKKSDRKSIANEQVTAKNSVASLNAENDETMIEEISRISGERSEIISELSHMMDKSIPLNRSSSKNSSNEAQKIQYESDTFEDASSSTGLSSSSEEQLKKTSEEEVVRHTIRSGVKQIMITPHKQTETPVKKTVPHTRDKEIIELVAPKIIQSTSECDIGLDEELSNYVRSTENVDEALPISLLKLSKQTTPTKKHLRKNKKHRKSSNENTEEAYDKEATSESSEHGRLTKQKENKGEDSSSTSVKNLEHQDKKKQSDEKNSSPTEQSKIQNVEAEKKESKSEAYNVEPETISSEKLLREIPRKSDVTSTLRKLNRDAIDAVSRRYRIQTPRETLNKSRQCRTCGTIVKLPSAEYEGSNRIDADENKSPSLENVKESTQHQRTKKRNKVKRVSKSSKVRRTSNREKVEEKQSRFDCRQMYRLRKQAVALRLQQEREDIRNYLLELERTRLEFGPGEATISSKVTPFKPLEFPKIAAFVKPDLEETNFKSNDRIAGLQERILTIRQWLKDQYVLYRDYSSLAQTVNAKYIPASLEDAKRTIRELQKATIKTR